MISGKPVRHRAGPRLICFPDPAADVQAAASRRLISREPPDRGDDAMSALLIFDEIPTGLGKTGRA
jgi:hypothetical protein